MVWWPENLTDWVVVISGIATAVLVVIVGRQLAITKKEFESRQRPWIGPVDVKQIFVQFENGDQIPFGKAMAMLDKDKSLKISYEINDLTITNTGNLPAKAYYRFMQSTEKLTKEKLTAIDVTHTISFMPGANDHMYIKISNKRLEEGKKHYIGIQIEYSLSNGKKSLVGKIWEVDKTGIEIIEDWINDPELN